MVGIPWRTGLLGLGGPAGPPPLLPWEGTGPAASARSSRAAKGARAVGPCKYGGSLASSER
jgi:hypothetical protein